MERSNIAPPNASSNSELSIMDLDDALGADTELFKEVELGQDLDLLGNRVRILFRAFRALRIKQAKEIGELLAKMAALQETFATHESIEEAWRKRIDNRLDAQHDLLKSMADSVLRHQVDEGAKWLTQSKQITIVLILVLSALILARKEVGDWLVIFGHWFGA
jgi:hypothetical protein